MTDDNERRLRAAFWAVGYRRVKDEPGFPEITDDEWDRWDWHDVTTFNHPGDVHVYVKGRERYARILNRPDGG
jgi:hypothetical protein